MILNEREQEYWDEVISILEKVNEPARPDWSDVRRAYEEGISASDASLDFMLFIKEGEQESEADYNNYVSNQQ